MKKILFLFVCSLFVSTLWSQNIQVTGLVTGVSDGQAIPGVTVLLKGSSKAVVTDLDGRYTISVPPNASLEFSLMGMNTVLVAVNARTAIDVAMEENSVILDDVVVIGYGSGKKLGTTVGSVARIKSETLENRPTANVVDALQGKVAGMQVFTSSGEPSASSSIRLHGVASFSAGSAPLYILDGLPVESGSIIALNPNDIESVTVMKDASSTSIYGARAANGVIVYTTKKGKVAQDAMITVRGQYGVSSLANTHFYDQLMNTEQVSQYLVATDYYTQTQMNNLLAGYPNDTKWGDYFYQKNAPTYSADIAIRGGGGNTTYYVSGAYFNQNGVGPGSNYQRYNLRSNVDSRLNKWLRMGVNISGSYDMTQTTRNMGNNVSGGVFYMLMPYYTPYSSDGSDADKIEGRNIWNPIAQAKRNPVATYAEGIGNGYFEIRPMTGLIIKLQGGLDIQDFRQTSEELPSYPWAQTDSTGRREGSVQESFGRNWRTSITNTVEYKFSIKDNHAFTALVGQEGISSWYNAFAASSNGQTNDQQMLLQHGTRTPNFPQSMTDEYAFLSFFARLDYGFKDKLFADFSIRNDQSSRFGPENRSAMFYSGGLMWNVKRESFLKDVSWLNTLNLRFSIGTSGNAEIGNHEHQALVKPFATDYNGATAWEVTTAGNSYLTWEKQLLTNIGLKTELWNKLRLELEFYNRITSDMLMAIPYPYTTGFSTVMGNVGKIRNRGIDITFDVDIIKTRDLYLNFSATFGYNDNRTLELFQGRTTWTNVYTGMTYAVGQPVSYYIPIYAGIDPADGAQMWYLPGDDFTKTTKEEITKKYTSPDALLQNTGHLRYPPYSGGFSLLSNWKGWSFQADFAWVWKKYMLNNDGLFNKNPNQYKDVFNQVVDVFDYWRKPGDVTEYPRIGSDQFRQYDTFYLEDASFLRMKNLSISYTLPALLMKKTGALKGARVFASARNLFTLTKYSGTDPEVDANIALGTYPNTRQFSIGAEITF